MLQPAGWQPALSGPDAQRPVGSVPSKRACQPADGPQPSFFSDCESSCSEREPPLAECEPPDFAGRQQADASHRPPGSDAFHP